jgi:hypothetical protein
MTDLSSICTQRRMAMLYTIPTNRYNPTIDSTPYPKYTRQQLDMRRKSEILKYYSNASNSKTNNLTKSQRWGQIVSVRNNITTCQNSNQIPNPDLIPTPTYASDIPGPIMYLIRDTTIPLYNYLKNNNAYAISQTPTTNKWNIITSNDIFFKDLVSTKLFSLFILDNIDKSSYTFSFSTPFAFYRMGNNSKSTKTNPLLNNIDFAISKVSVSVLYSGNPVNTQNINTSFSIYDMCFNIHANSNAYSSYLYGGILSISNMEIITNPGFIYDIYLNIDFAFNDPLYNLLNGNSYSSNFNSITSGIYCNLSNRNIKTSLNTTLNTSSPNIPFTNYSITGV